jgi:hypothetical protein
MRALSPVSLLFACWGVTVGLASWALSEKHMFHLVPLFMAREDLDPAAFGLLGALWIVTALAVYVTADMACRLVLPRRQTFAAGVDLERAARFTFAVNAAFLGITLAWVGITALQNGGVSRMMLTVVTENRHARDMLLENKLFAGMRLFYAALPATGCLAAAVLAAGHGRLSGKARLLCRLILLGNAIALFVLPIVMSQRLLLLQFILSAWITNCVIRGRIVGLVRIAVGAALFLVVWILRESVTNPTIAGGAADIGLQKLAFYVVNDLWNSVAPLNADFAHTLGVFSLKGLMFITFTDEYFSALLAARVDGVDGLRGGGEFSLFTAPFVDFGLTGAVIFIAVMAILFRLVFHLGRQRLGWAAVYGQIGATLLYSSHSLYATHQNFLVSLMVIAVVLRLSRRARALRPATALLAERWRNHNVAIPLVQPVRPPTAFVRTEGAHRAA